MLTVTIETDFFLCEQVVCEDISLQEKVKSMSTFSASCSFSAPAVLRAINIRGAHVHVPTLSTFGASVVVLVLQLCYEQLISGVHMYMYILVYKPARRGGRVMIPLQFFLTKLGVY